MYKQKLTLILSLLIFAITLNAQEKITIGESIKLSSKIMEEDRTILIRVPGNYEKDTDKKYPVLYTLDGNTHFKRVVGTIEWLSESSAMIEEHIVVAITNTQRFRDLSTSKMERNPTAGGADKFLKFIKEELIPYVDKNYRTNPFKTLAGHSLAGLFTVHTMMTQTNLFNAYIAMAPALGYNSAELITRTETLLKADNNLPTFLYMTLGNEPRRLPNFNNLAKVFETEKPKDFVWEKHLYDNETHMSVPSRTLHNALLSLSYYAGWRLKPELAVKGIDAVQSHLEDLSEKFGYDVKVIGQSIEQIGALLIADKKLNETISLYEMYTSLFPESSWAYSSLARAYNSAKQYKNALIPLKKAIELAEKYKTRNLRWLKSQVKPLEERIKNQ